MDSVISGFSALSDSDLMLCHGHGVAYQKDMSITVPYDDAYLHKYDVYEQSEIGKAINKGRLDFVAKHLPKGSSILDVGACAGTFIHGIRDRGYISKGFDVNRSAVNRLILRNEFAENANGFDALTFWDSLEHIEEPAKWFICQSIFIAVPLFESLSKIRQSKHYRPGEHFYYWTESGFVEWMEKYSYRLVEKSTHEIDAGREDIGSFLFKKC